MTFNANDLYVAVLEHEQELDRDDQREGDHFFANGGKLEGFGKFTPYDSQPRNYWDEGDCWYVLKHVESGRLFFRTGEYTSYDGFDWGVGVKEVTKTEVTVPAYMNTSGDIVVVVK